MTFSCRFFNRYHSWWKLHTTITLGSEAKPRQVQRRTPKLVCFCLGGGTFNSPYSSWILRVGNCGVNFLSITRTGENKNATICFRLSLGNDKWTPPKKYILENTARNNSLRVKYGERACLLWKLTKFRTDKKASFTKTKWSQATSSSQNKYFHLW